MKCLLLPSPTYLSCSGRRRPPKRRPFFSLPALLPRRPFPSFLGKPLLPLPCSNPIPPPPLLYATCGGLAGKTGCAQRKKIFSLIPIVKNAASKHSPSSKKCVYDRVSKEKNCLSSFSHGSKREIPSLQHHPSGPKKGGRRRRNVIIAAV